MVKYIHIKYLLRFLREKEGKRYKIVNSEDYGIKGDNSFKIIIPLSFEVEKIIFSYNNGWDYSLKVLDKDGKNAIDESYILFWNNELYSTEKEKSVCISDVSIDEGFVMFYNFMNIPEFVESSEILSFVD